MEDKFYSLEEARIISNKTIKKNAIKFAKKVLEKQDNLVLTKEYVI